MTKGCRALLLLVCAALCAACGSGGGDLSTVPDAPAAPAALPFTGTFDLDAPIVHFDPAWGDLTGFRYRAVLTFEASPSGQLTGASGGTVIGSFAGLRVIDRVGTPESPEISGSIVRRADFGGHAVFELVADSFHWTASVDSGTQSLIAGNFGTGGHIGGPFTARSVGGK